MSFNPTLWNRLEYSQIPIYVRKDKPDWFVPNKAGDQILRDLSQGLIQTLILPPGDFLIGFPMILFLIILDAHHY